MCNCGNKRNVFNSNQSLRSGANESNVQPQKKIWEDRSFEYTGNTALTVTGRITGKQYRYNKKGEVQQIDYRDAGAMLTVPVLRRVK